MGSQPRIKTKYPGVFYREAKRLGGSGIEKVYYVVFKVAGKVIEEKVGRQFQDAMTPAKANTIRSKLVDGQRKTRKEVKAAKSVKVWTFQALWEEYALSKVKNRSFKTDELRYQKYIMPFLASKEPNKLVPLDIERVRLSMQKAGMAPQTVKHVLALIKRIANFGENHGLCSNVKFKIKIPIVDNKKTEDLSPEELTRLIAAIDDDSNRAVATMMKLALFTGMRKGEIFKLHWDDINFHRGFILIRSPKGGMSQEIPLNGETEKLLRSWDKTPGSAFVFPGHNGGQRATISAAAKKIKKAAGLPDSFRPMHGLRHVYASMLASSGKVDMYTLQKLLTHKSPVMTQRYAHLRDETLKRAAELAGNIINMATASSQDINETSGHTEDVYVSKK